MKNRLLLSTILVMSCCGLSAQTIHDLFQQKTSLSRNFSNVASKYEALEINTPKLAALKSESRQQMDLELPFENKTLKLKLQKTRITAENFVVTEALPGGGRRNVAYNDGIFYQGKIEGQENSSATISIFNDRVMGIIADGKSNIVLGSIESGNGRATNEYTLYRDENLKINNPFYCATPDTPIDGEAPATNPLAHRTEAVGEPVDIYFECDFRFYQDKGSNTDNVINYVLGFFNNTAMLYNNENIKVQVSQILVWTTTDPEAGFNTTSTVLNSFGPRMNTTTYIGDYAHFLSTRSLGGGVAYLLSNPCASGKQFRTGVSAINNSYNNFPTYSWTVMVVTHELGHNFGSPHTQSCSWPGGPIDNCVTVEPAGGCAPGPPPVNGGTIMSYCHLTAAGINFNNGFGPLPGDRIRSVIGAASCFGTCRMTIDLAKTDASCGQNNGSAVVTPTNGTGAITYAWSNGQTGATLSNVGPGTYYVTVRDASNCQVMQTVTIVNTGPTLNATLTPAAATSFCTGGNVLLTASTGTGYTYQWSKDAVPIGGATSNTYTATSTGNYSVLITSGSCSVTRSVQITEVPVPTANVTAGGPTTFCSGNSVVLNGNAGTGYSYQWYNNAVAIGGATNPSYTATTSGNYTVRVSASGCEATSSPVNVTVNASPSATVTAGGPIAFCVGGSVTLNAATGTGYTYQWQNNGSPIGGATNASYTATASGNYNVVVTLGSCTVTSATTAVTASPAPTASITAGGATTFCSGNSVILNANTGTGYTYQWFRDGNSIGGATNASYTATTAGSYTVRVTLGTCNATSAATAVTVNPSPTATISAGSATTFCAGGSVTLNASTGTGYAYQWYNNGNLISGAVNAAYTANSSGNYTVRITAAGCETTSAATAVTVNPVPSATITANGATAFCNGGSVTLVANSGSGYTYQWYNNGNSIPGATNNSYAATATGNYTVKVTATGCEATSSATSVTVSPAPVATVTAGGALSFCAGNNVVLNANTGTGYTYQWFRDGNTIGGATNASYTASTTGNYTVLITLGTCNSTSPATAVNVLATPAVSVSPGNSTIQKFQTQTLTASGAATYNWASQPALVGSTASTGTVRPLTTTTYTIEGTGSNGCKSTSTATVIVIGCGEVTNITSTAYSPSRVLISWTNPQDVTTDTLQYRKAGTTSWTNIYVTGTSYELSGLDPASTYEYRVIPLCSTSSVFVPSATQNFTTDGLPRGLYIKLFPNPVSTTARLEVIVDQPYDLQIAILNSTGQQVRQLAEINSTGGQTIRNIDVTTLPEGTYFVVFTINDKKYYVKMLVAK